MTPRLIAAVLAAALARTSALDAGHAARKQAPDAIEIPDWRLDLASGEDDWWKTHVSNTLDKMKNIIWGDDYPMITASPAQDGQRCPVVKLPPSFTAAPKRSTWRSLYGEWNADNDVVLATWEQNYLNMGFSRNIKRVGVHIHTAATGQLAIRTRLLSDEDMTTLYNWKALAAGANASNASTVGAANASANGAANASAASATKAAGLEEYADYNIAIFDCVGALMYVVKERTQFPQQIKVFARDGSLIATSYVGHPVLRYQFVDPTSGYLIGTAEAPGINASIKLEDIPRNVQEGDVVPFGFRFEKGGYTNSSALMETEYHWVLATVIQSLAIYKAERESPSWYLITAVEAYLIFCIAAVIVAVGGSFFCIYRCVFPHGHDDEFYFGRHAAENPFLTHHKDAALLQPRAKGYGDSAQVGWHGGASGYGTQQ